MGAYAPVSFAPPRIGTGAVDRVFTPTLRAMREQGCTFTGLLYAGLMLTPEGLKVVEFNCRFGDPETQAILPLMASSLLVPLRAVAEGGSLRSVSPFGWHKRFAVTTVVAAGGYPGKVRAGDAITLPQEPRDVTIFHAGTARASDGTLVTAGGRIVAVTGLGATLESARALSAATAAEVRFEGRQFRSDIGWRDLARRA